MPAPRIEVQQRVVGHGLDDALSRAMDVFHADVWRVMVRGTFQLSRTHLWVEVVMAEVQFRPSTSEDTCAQLIEC